MALQALNSVAGFSVGELANIIIYANSDIVPANLVVSGKSNLNSISNIAITGGSPGYIISTDGFGNLSFIAPPSTSGITNGTSNVSIPTLNGNITLSVGGTANILLVTTTGTESLGNINPATANAYELGNTTNRWNNVFANTGNFSGNVNAQNLVLGNSTITTTISYYSVNTSSVTANQTIASINASGITGLEFLVKGVDSTGSKYSVATVQAVTDGSSVDYTTFAVNYLGGSTGVLAVNISGSNVDLQVTPSSINNTVWTTQVRMI